MAVHDLGFPDFQWQPGNCFWFLKNEKGEMKNGKSAWRYGTGPKRTCEMQYSRSVYN
jgi:hypothetical protein